MKFSILGAGEMGRWFADFGKERGWEVVISDKDNEKSRKVSEDLGVRSAPDNKTAVEGADIVLVSVPIGATPEVIENVSKYLDEGSLLMDIASVQKDAVSAMEGVPSDFELVSLHPLFGPGAESLDGKNIVTVKVRSGEKYEDFEEVISDEGAKVVEMEAENHDRMMATVQSLTHFTLLSYLSALNSMDGLEREEILQTPMFRRLFEIAEAYLREDPGLCADIQRENDYSPEARKSLIEACQNLDSAFDDNDIESIMEVFDEAMKKIGSEKVEEAYKRLYEDLEGDRV